MPFGTQDEVLSAPTGFGVDDEVLAPSAAIPSAVQTLNKTNPFNPMGLSQEQVEAEALKMFQGTKENPSYLDWMTSKETSPFTPIVDAPKNLFQGVANLLHAVQGTPQGTPMLPDMSKLDVAKDLAPEVSSNPAVFGLLNLLDSMQRTSENLVVRANPMLPMGLIPGASDKVLEFVSGLKGSAGKQLSDLATDQNVGMAVATAPAGVAKGGASLVGKILGSVFIPEVAGEALPQMVAEKSVEMEQAQKQGQPERFSAGSVGKDVGDVGGLLAMLELMRRGTGDTAVTKSGLTPEDIAEPGRYEPSGVRVRPSQQSPVVIGEQVQPKEIVVPGQEQVQVGPAELVYPGFYGMKKPEVVGGKISWGSPAEGGAVPSARQSASVVVRPESIPQESPVVVQGSEGPYRKPFRAPTPEEMARRSRRADVEAGMHQPSGMYVGSEELPYAKEGQFPAEGGPTGTLSQLQRSRMLAGKEGVRSGVRNNPPEEPPVQPEKKSGRLYMNPVGPIVKQLGKDIQELADKEKELRGTTFALSGPRIAVSESGFKDVNKKVDARQLSGRVQNLLKQRAPSEWQMYEDAGVWKTVEGMGKVSPKEVAEVMQREGPKVKVEKFGEGLATQKERAEKAQLEHKLDTLLPNWRQLEVEEIDTKGKEITDAYYRWQDLGEYSSEPSASHWSSVAPKPESDMPGYTEIAVVKPNANRAKIEELAKQQEALRANTKDANYAQKVYALQKQIDELAQGGKAEPQFPSSHSFPPNTLGFSRGYMETLPNGKKVWHVLEVQSDWAQEMRKIKEGDDQVGYGFRSDRTTDDPLLAHHERLSLKAAIEHAKEQGADYIAIQDAESAMLMEGHDRVAAAVTPISVENLFKRLQRNGKGRFVPEKEMVNLYGSDWENGKFVDFQNEAYRIDKPELNYTQRKKNLAKELVPYVGEKNQYIPQEPGMRLHYDQTLPRILEEMTGQKGERVEFGEHKMAYEPRTDVQGINFSTEAEARRYAGPQGTVTRVGSEWEGLKSNARSDLIFRNPDGTPKTSISARMYDISKMDTTKPFSLIEKDKGGGVTRSASLYMNPVGPIAKQAAKDLKEAFDSTANYLKGAGDKVLPALAFDTKSPLPDYQPKEVANQVFSQPFAAEKVPVLGRLMGGKARIRTPQDEAIATWYAERHGVAPAIAASTGEQIRGKIKGAFSVSKEGDLNVTPTKAGQSLKMSDVFESLRRDPNSYQLTSQQRQVFDTVVDPLSKRMSELAHKYEIIDELVDENGDFRPYFPRIVTEHPKVEVTGSAFQRQRAFSSEAEGWKRGYKYELDPEKRLVTGIERLYRAIANQRLAKDPVLGSKTAEQLKADLAEYYAEELGSGAMTQRKVDRIAEGIKTQGQVYQPILVRKIFDAKTAKKLNAEFAAEQSSVRQSIATANNLLKALQLGFDLGVGQIQMLPTIYNNPKVWGMSQIKSFQAMVKPEVFSEYVRQNKEVISEMNQMGSSVGKLSEFMAGSGKGEVLSKIPLVGQTAGAFGRQFQTALDVAKVELWKAWRDVTPKAEWPKTLQAIESTLLSARMESAMVPHGRSLLERVALLAPSYYRGAVNFVAALGEKGVSGKVARRAMGRFILGSTMTYLAVAKMIGMDDDQIQKRLNPGRMDFLMWDVPQGDQRVNVGFGGIFRSFLKLGSSMLRTSVEHPENWKSLSPESNPVTRWYRGHAGPTISLAWEGFTGKDFLGRKSDVFSLGKRTVPLLAQQAFTPEGEAPATPVEYTSSFFGLSSFPEGYTDRRQRILAVESQNQYGKSYKDLTLNQRAKVEKAVEPKLKAIPKGMSPERQREIALKVSDERAAQLVEDLSESNRAYAKSSGIQIPSYRPSQKVRGETVHLTADEAKTLHGYMVEEYNKALEKLKNAKVETMSEASRKARVEGAFEIARVRAWNRIRKEAGRTGSVGNQ